MITYRGSHIISTVEELQIIAFHGSLFNFLSINYNILRCAVNEIGYYPDTVDGIEAIGSDRAYDETVLAMYMKIHKEMIDNMHDRYKEKKYKYYDSEMDVFKPGDLLANIAASLSKKE